MPSALNVTKISSGTDGTQIWKITHNGVDTHPIHFHLYNVQVLNRVTWDNIIIPPEPTELGWKETVRVSPLEDTIVALRPIVPTLPFGIPDSKRVLNPAMPLHAQGDINSVLGTEAGFNNTDVAGNPMIAAIANEVTDFGWEYVFHCHILSHEEMDMMRPVTVHVPRNFAPASTLTAVRNVGSVDLTWTDGTPVDMTNPTSWTNPGTAEIGYRIERASGANGAFSVVGTTLANQLTFTDTVDTNQTWRYRITAFNAAGDSRSNVVTVAAPVTLKTTTTALKTSKTPSTYGQSVTFTATVKSTTTGTPTGTVQFNINGVPAVGGVRTINGSGVATFSSSSVPGGHNSIVAIYSGDAAFSASTERDPCAGDHAGHLDNDADEQCESLKALRELDGDVHRQGDAVGRGSRPGSVHQGRRQRRPTGGTGFDRTSDVDPDPGGWCVHLQGYLHRIDQLRHQPVVDTQPNGHRIGARRR